MNFADIDLTCDSCGATFVFSAGEQHFYVKKGYTNRPKRCRLCRVKGLKTIDRRAVCADCGTDTTVPFRPTQNRPVYCRECFEKRHSQSVPGKSGSVLEEPAHESGL
jgi:CxxC-x17-CxxC domain-containing protein